MRAGEVQIAVGTRSAVFAPFRDLGLVIMDEEQNTLINRNPLRGITRGGGEVPLPLPQGDAASVFCDPPLWRAFTTPKTGDTPSTGSKAQYGNAVLPEVTVVDMNEELSAGNTSAFSGRLAEALEENLRQKRQSILLLNRRGVSHLVACRACGEVLCCPNCSIS